MKEGAHASVRVLTCMYACVRVSRGGVWWGSGGGGRVGGGGGGVWGGGGKYVRYTRGNLFIQIAREIMPMFCMNCYGLTPDCILYETLTFLAIRAPHLGPVSLPPALYHHLPIPPPHPNLHYEIRDCSCHSCSAH